MFPIAGRTATNYLTLLLWSWWALPGFMPILPLGSLQQPNSFRRTAILFDRIFEEFMTGVMKEKLTSQLRFIDLQKAGKLTRRIYNQKWCFSYDPYRWCDSYWYQIQSAFSRSGCQGGYQLDGSLPDDQLCYTAREPPSFSVILPSSRKNFL